MNLRHWLKKTPRPVAVLADDQRIDVANNHRAINDLIATIQALEPSKLTCLDREGKVIRSVQLDTEESKPAVSSPPSADMSDLQHFATLLSDAYKTGASTNQPLVDRAMQFVERNSERLAAAEREIERLRQHNNKLHQQILELSIVPVPAPASADDGGIVGSLVAGIMQGQMAKMVPQPTPTPIRQPNGARKQQ